MIKKIGHVISKLRKENNMSQDQLANLVGVSRQAISKWERDEGLPDLYNVRMLAEVFDVSIDELLCHERKHDTNEVIIEKNKDLNHLPKILYGIPSFLFVIGGFISFLIMLIMSPLLTYSIITGKYMDYNINPQFYLTYIPISISFIYLTTYKNLFINNNLSRTKTISTIISGLFVIGFLSILFFVNLHGFSIIFLYITLLLIFISGLVGSILIKTDNKYTTNISNKIEVIYKKVVKISKSIIILSTVILMISLVQNTFLLKKVALIDTMIYESNPKIEDPVLPTLANSCSNEYRIKFKRNYNEINEYNVDIYFSCDFSEVDVIDSKASFYLNNSVIGEGNLIKENSDIYSIHIKSTFKGNIYVLDDDSYREPLLITYDIKYKDNNTTKEESYSIEVYPSGTSYSTDYIWIWEYNKLLNN